MSSSLTQRVQHIRNLLQNEVIGKKKREAQNIGLTHAYVHQPNYTLHIEASNSPSELKLSFKM